MSTSEERKERVEVVLKTLRERGWDDTTVEVVRPVVEQLVRDAAGKTDQELLGRLMMPGTRNERRLLKKRMKK
jgi:hypothetical protein